MIAIVPPPEVPIILIVAIPAETVTVEIPEPLKSNIVAPVPTVPPAVDIPTPGFIRTEVAIQLEVA